MKIQWGKLPFGKKKNSRDRKLPLLWYTIVAVGVVVVGITGAWLVNRADIATLLAVVKPSTISVKGPNGEQMAQLDLTYTDKDKDANGKVTINRVISVVSDHPEHRIEIAHTTNLKGLTFEVHKAVDVNKDAATGEYTCKKGAVVAGDYLNRDAAISTTDYQYADHSMHSENYSDYQNVQSHAEPLYWLQTDTTNVNYKNADDLYLQNYVLTISWTESTKETDLFYILAKNIEDTTTGN